MNKFNLTFSGEILPGFKPARVKAAFAKLFAIDDPKRVDLFFSGRSVVLRRNLERKEAADYFRKRHDIGLRSELVKVDEDGQPVVFVQVGGESFERRMVRTGLRDATHSEVVDGLDEGERVVVNGAYVVRLVSLSGAIPEHTH